MLPSRNARNRFSAWRTSSRILVYDADAAAIPENSNINGLLRKFKNDGYEGELTWLRGGFQAVWRERKELVDARPPTPETEHDDDDDDNGEASMQGQGQPAILRARHLPSQAFCLSSTMLHNSSHSNVKRHPMQLKTSLPSSSSAHHPAANPFFDTIRQNVELSHGITERIPLRLPRRVRRRIDDLKSFPWLQRIAQRAGKAPPAVDHPSSDPSSDDSSDEPLPGDSYGDTLATQFYGIERAEQHRLMGIMEYHAKQSGPVSDGHTLKATLFPYSITAGVEKGAKNRYACLSFTSGLLLHLPQISSYLAV
jgi:protein-tyrosine phosphatase